jgi:hypothetical protein
MRITICLRACAPITKASWQRTRCISSFEWGSRSREKLVCSKDHLPMEKAVSPNTASSGSWRSAATCSATCQRVVGSFSTGSFPRSDRLCQAPGGYQGGTVPSTNSVSNIPARGKPKQKFSDSTVNIEVQYSWSFQAVMNGGDTYSQRL